MFICDFIAFISHLHESSHDDIDDGVFILIFLHILTTKTRKIHVLLHMSLLNIFRSYDVEGSFSQYKNLVSNRRSFSFANILNI